jgi:hypothetical protein
MPDLNRGPGAIADPGILSLYFDVKHGVIISFTSSVNLFHNCSPLSIVKGAVVPSIWFKLEVADFADRELDVLLPPPPPTRRPVSTAWHPFSFSNSWIATAAVS